MTPQELEAALAARHAEIVEHIGWRGELAGSLRERAATIFQAATNLPSNSYIASGVAGVPTPLLLAYGRPVAIDLTPQTIQDCRKSFGLSVAAIAHFAGVIYPNVFGYDGAATAEERLRVATAYAEADREHLLPALLARAPQQLYFLPTLRDHIFTGTYRHPTLRDMKNTGAFLHDVAKAHRQDRSSPSDWAAAAAFRGGDPHPEAAAWHWAYLSCAGIADHDGFGAVSNLIDELKRRSEAGTLDEGDSHWFDVAGRLRSLHLVHTAPLTGAFGHVYQMTEAEARFAENMRLWSTDEQAAIHHADAAFVRCLDALVQGMLPGELTEAAPAAVQTRLAEAACVVALARGARRTDLLFDDPRKRDALIDYVRSGTGRPFDGLDRAFTEPANWTMTELRELADESVAARREANRELERLLDLAIVLVSPLETPGGQRHLSVRSTSAQWIRAIERWMRSTSPGQTPESQVGAGRSPVRVIQYTASP